jgi:hypothetical protein
VPAEAGEEGKGEEKKRGNIILVCGFKWLEQT